MSYFIALVIGLAVGIGYGLLNFKSPAPPVIALVGLLGMHMGEQLLPWGRTLIEQWLR